MTSLKINTIESDTTTTFSQVPSISATVSAYPTIGTTIPTTTWVKNTINTLLSPYALISSLSAYATVASLSAYATVASLSAYAQLSSANFTTLTRNSQPVITTTTQGVIQNIIYKSGTAIIASSIATILFTDAFPGAMTGAVVSVVSGTATRTVTASLFTTTGFTIYSSAAGGSASWIAFGY